MSSARPPRSPSFPLCPEPSPTSGHDPDLQDLVAERARALAIDAHAGLDLTPPPFDPERIAARMGIPVVHARLPEGMDALLVPRGGEFRIVVNTQVRNRARVRFSIAHELAHTFFAGAESKPQHRTARARHEDEENPGLERLCDRGAAEMLMPEPAVRDVLRSADGALGVVAIAAAFEVSLEAACVRFLEFAPPELRAVGIFEYAVRPSLRGGALDASAPEIPAYRARRVFARPGFPYLFPPGKSVPADSAIVRASWRGRACAAVETFATRDDSRELRVSAHPVPDPMRRPLDGGRPPVVCAVLMDTEDASG